MFLAHFSATASFLWGGLPIQLKPWDGARKISLRKIAVDRRILSFVSVSENTKLAATGRRSVPFIIHSLHHSSYPVSESITAHVTA